MQRKVPPILLAFTLAIAVAAQSGLGEENERRLEQYRCVLRLPSPDFTWLAEDDIPGATLACRDSKDRFVILAVAEAPPGYQIDLRQGAAFEKGMDRKPGIERLGGRLNEFLGVPCYDIRGRLKTDQSLTLTRFFAANGFLCDLQAMIPAPSDGEAGELDDLFAAFQFIGSTANPGTGGAPQTAVSIQEKAIAIPVASSTSVSEASNRDVQTSSEVQASPNFSRAPSTQAPQEDDLPQGTEPQSRSKFWTVAITAGGVMGVICSVILVRFFRNGP